MAEFTSGATPEYRKRVASAWRSYSREFWEVMDSLGMTARVRWFQKRAEELLNQAIQDKDVIGLRKIIGLGDAHTEKLRTRIGTDVAETINLYTLPGTILAIRAEFALQDLEAAFVARVNRISIDHLMNKKIT
jgi:hypothetical protein